MTAADPAGAGGATPIAGPWARAQPWLVAIVGMWVLFMSNGLTATGLSVFDPALLDEYGWSRGELKFRDVLTFWISAALAVPVGLLIDRVDPRYVLMAGMLCVSAGLTGYAFLPVEPRAALLQVYAIHVFFGFGMACAGGAVVVVLVSSWFLRHRGFAIGIALVGTSLGSAILPPLNVSVMQSSGWRSAFVLDAALPLALFVVAWALLRGTPGRAGVRVAGQSRGIDDLRRHGLTFAQALRTRSFYAIAASGFLAYYSIMSFLQHLVLHMNLGLGFSLAEAARGFLLFSLLAMTTKLAAGALADRIDRHRVFVGSIALMLAGALGLATLERPILWMAISAIGLGWGGTFTLYSMLAVGNFGLREIGRINGIIVFCEALGTGLGSFVTGRLYDAYGSYRIPFLLVAAMLLGALALALLVRDETSLASFPASAATTDGPLPATRPRAGARFEGAADDPSPH